MKVTKCCQNFEPLFQILTFMKLLSLLYENIDPYTIILAMTVSSDPFLRGPANFYKNNKAIFDRILADATEFRLLGRGAEGMAYSLGNNKVLKLSFSGSETRDRMESGLFSQKNLGRFYPMIYDTGTMTDTEPPYPETSPVYYTIMEMLETVPKKWNVFLDSLYAFLDRNDYIPAGSIRKEVEASFPEAHKLKQFESELRLTPNWIQMLHRDRKQINKSTNNYADLNYSNAGIRRVGGEGYLVFFDQ